MLLTKAIRRCCWLSNSFNTIFDCWCHQQLEIELSKPLFPLPGNCSRRDLWIHTQKVLSLQKCPNFSRQTSERCCRIIFSVNLKPKQTKLSITDAAEILHRWIKLQKTWELSNHQHYEDRLCTRPTSYLQIKRSCFDKNENSYLFVPVLREGNFRTHWHPPICMLPALIQQ